MNLETLREKSKNISIFCIVLNLVIILASQCYLLLQTETETARSIPYDMEHTNKRDLNPLTLRKEICSAYLKSTVQRQKPCFKNSNRMKYAAVAGTTLIEMFIDLPINILLFFAIKYKKKKRVIPWLIFNSLRICAIVAIVCILVIFNIIGLDQFIGETDVVVSTSGDNHSYLGLDKRYMPK